MNFRMVFPFVFILCVNAAQRTPSGAEQDQQSWPACLISMIAGVCPANPATKS
jgi:hypothetical protein